MYGPTYNKPGANLLKMIIFLSSFLLSTTAEKVLVASSKGTIRLDGSSTLYGVCNFGQKRRRKFEDAVKNVFPSSPNASVSIVKVTYSNTCSNAVRRRLMDKARELQETEAENLPSTRVAYSVTTDDNVNTNIFKAEIDVTDSINKKFEKVVTASKTKIVLDPTLISIQSNQDILATRLDTIEATISAKIESMEAKLETLMQSLISAVKTDTEAIYGSVSSVETDLVTMNTDIAAVKTDTATIISSISNVETDVADVDTDVAAVKTNTEAIIGSVSDVETGIADIDTDVADVKNNTEVIIGSVSDLETGIADVNTDVIAVKSDTEAIMGSISNVTTDIAVVDTDVAAVKNNIADVDADVAAVKNDTEAIIGSVSDLETAIVGVDTDVLSAVKNDTEAIIGSVSSVETDIADVDTDVAAVKTDTEAITDSLNEGVKYLSDQLIHSDSPSSIPSISNSPSLSPSNSPTILLLQFSIESSHACATDSSKVQCVGFNGNGQAGFDPNISTSMSTPNTLTFSSIATPKKVATGGSHTCVLLSDDTAMCLGSNMFGQLGNGNPEISFHTPVYVKKNGAVLTNIADIAAGNDHTCVILNDASTNKELYCFGSDTLGFSGHLGFSGEPNVKMMALSQFATCIVLTTDETQVKCEGGNLNDKVFLMGAKIVTLTAGVNHFCALLEDSTAKCFGDNYQGQLGNGSTTDSYNAAMDVLASAGNELSGITDIEAGTYSTCLVANGTPMCFGDNRNYQLGIRSEIDYSTGKPSDVLYPTALDVTLPADKEVVSVHVGFDTGHAVFTDNTVYAWGTNDYGTLGDGSSISGTNVIGDELREAAVLMAFNF
ncbi:hypothetical protein CTEN210_11859 [Chaetoceros tenuissimus]|uniref:Uncharacterized protein n=1 Tax=Chaetoceros tenuissimus TaxID=426638 RepID=A0AAD3H9Y0_9STRA|nr:hypothetical protein CTEN210_11859 [Chaetoceros tenuissimus]